MNGQKGQGNPGRMDSRRCTHGAQAGGGKMGLLGVKAPLGVCVEVRRPGGVGPGPRQVWGSYAADSGLCPVLIGWVAHSQVLIFPFVFNSVLRSSLGAQGCLDLAVLKN